MRKNIHINDLLFVCFTEHLTKNMLCSHRTEFGFKLWFQDSMDTIHLDQLFGLQWGTSEALDKIF